MITNILIVGSKSTALEIYEVAKLTLSNKYYNLNLVIGNDEINNNSEYNYIRDYEIKSFVSKNNCKYIISFSNQKLRLKFIEMFQQFQIESINVIHPSAIISPTTSIGKGNYIAAGAVLSTNSIVGNCNIINYNALIGHDSKIGSNCILNPGCKISGSSIIEDRVLIGANSVIFQGVKIEQDCIIDALTFVPNDVEKEYICSSRSIKKFKRVM